MIRRIVSFTFCALASLAFSAQLQAQSHLTAKANVAKTAPTGIEETDRMRDGLTGPVRRVRTEVVKLSTESGEFAEGKHAVLELVSYDIKGSKVENQYFPIAGANLTGKEVYKYDEKGNISEMTLLNTDGSLLSKETYKYEFDFAGNWSKMTTAVAVIEGGKMSFEPTEVTYRSIMYYLDENMMKMSQPAATSVQPNSSAAVPAGNTGGAKPENSTAALPKAPINNKANANQKTSSALPSVLTNASDKLGSSNPVEFARGNANVGSLEVKVDSEPPPPAAPRTILKPVSGGVLNGTAINLPAPSYPESARRLRTSGLVTVEVIVDETGKVISAVATGGPMGLRDVAMQAALKARFSPTKLSGQPVKVAGLINYKFALAQ